MRKSIHKVIETTMPHGSYIYNEHDDDYELLSSEGASIILWESEGLIYIISFLNEIKETKTFYWVEDLEKWLKPETKEKEFTPYMTF